MPQKMQSLRVPAITSWADTLEPRADTKQVFHLLNCSIDRDGATVVNRQGWHVMTADRMGTAGSYLNDVAYEWAKTGATLVRVLVQAGQIYTADATLDPGAAPVVTTANFTTASITVSATAPIYCVPFGGNLVFSDGTNTPWMWDGTSGAGGLTKLTNAPVAYGAPTVHYARLFFITAADHTVIEWSEVNQPNVGYVASGYNNQWALTQTGSRPLVAILGRNEGLYYWRDSSIGMIRGSVTSNFTNDGTHDGIAEDIGCHGAVGGTTSRAMPLDYGDAIYFVDRDNRPWRIQGGQLQYLGMTIERHLASRSTAAGLYKPFNVGEGDLLGIPQQIVSHPALGQVWFVYTTADTPYVLAIRTDTGQPVGAHKWASARIGCFAPFQTTIGSTTDYHGIFGIAGNAVVSLDAWKLAAVYGTDIDDLGGTVYVCTIIGAPQGYSEEGEWSFDEIVLTYETGSSDASALVYVDYLTDRTHYSTLMPAAQSASAYDASYTVKQQRARFGIAGSGSWIMPRILLAGNHRIGIKGWTVLGFFTPLETVVVA